MLIWINEQPFFHFYYTDGICLWLNFGLDYVDDIEIKSEMFFINLKMYEEGWQVELDKNRSFGLLNKNMIDNLINEINQALIKRENYNVADYVVAHKDSESYFTYAVWEESP